MNIILSDQIVGPGNVLRGETGPNGQNIFGHTDVLINDKHFRECQYVYNFKTINKDNSYFYKNTRLSFNMGPVLPQSIIRLIAVAWYCMHGCISSLIRSVVTKFAQMLCVPQS